MRILVVEDSSTLSQLAGTILIDHGFDVLCPPTFEETVRLLIEPGIDAIVLEISDPACSGVELFRQLSALNADLPIVVFSTQDDRNLALEFLKRGAQDYLVKDIAGQESLAHSLENSIERHQFILSERSGETRIKDVLEHSYDAFIALDAEWTIIDWNSQAETTFGWKRQEMIGQNFSRVIPHHLQRQFSKNIKNFFAKHEGRLLKRSAEIIAERRSGKAFPAEFGIFRVNRGSAFLYYAFVRDITNYKNSNEELERLVHERTEELTQTNEQLRQFAKIASHDLQEPLRAVQGFASLLAERTSGTLNKDCTEFIEFILDGTQRMKQLIQSILIHSQMDAAASINQITNCNSIIEEVLTDLRSSIDDSNASIDIDTLPKVAVERSQLVQLFQNLISNSIKYRSASAPVIAITAKKAVHQWLFSVQDNGIGIEPQYAHKIFDMFSRLHSKGEYAGTGIGLAICKKIVTSHGGSIWIESVPGQGSIFLFTLPAVKEERKIKMTNKIEILLVEDSPADVRLTQEALKHSPLNYEITVATDGVEALKYLNELKTTGKNMPSIILLDLNLPRKNGHEVLEEIKSDPLLRPIPVVLLTVSERDEDVMEAMRLKMNYYVAKPVTAEKLSTLIKAIYELQLDDQTDNSQSTEETHIRVVLAGNPHTSLTALRKLADDPNEQVRCRVAENLRLTEDLQIKLANDSEAEVRISLCENSNLIESVLELLAKDANEDVRLAVASSPKVTAPLLKQLVDDENVYVSASANRSLGGLV